MSISRREFLKYCGLTAAAFALPSLPRVRPQQAVGTVIDTGAPTLLEPSTALLVSPAGEAYPSLPWAVVRAGQDLQWQVQVPQTGYYRLALTWQKGPAGWGLRAQIMLGDRILATLYGTAPLPGPVRIEAGTYTLTIRNLAWPLVLVRSLIVTPTLLACPAPVATFCVVQDWHSDRVPVPPDPDPLPLRGLYNRYLDLNNAALRDQEALQGFRQVSPDFLVSNGDSLWWGTPDSIPAFALLTSGLPFPWYATMGHHETKRMVGARECIETSWGAALPGGVTSYAFPYAGVLFVFVDSAYFQDPLTGKMYPYPPADWVGQLGCTPQIRAWLKSVLSANRAGDRLPVVVFTHHTLIYRPPTPALAGGWPWLTSPPYDAANMLALIGADHCVRAVLTGHAHFQQSLTFNNVLHLQGAAMGEGAMTFLRGLIFADHLEFETYQPVSLTHLLQSSLSPNSWAVGYPGDINTQVRF